MQPASMRGVAIGCGLTRVFSWFLDTLLEQGAAKGFIARWGILQEVDRPSARLLERILGALKQTLTLHHAPHVNVDRRLIAQRHIDHPVFDLRAANEQPHQATMIEHDPARLSRDAELF